MEKNTIKYPRVVVSAKRHQQLTAEAKKLKITIAQLLEQKLKTVK